MKSFRQHLREFDSIYNLNAEQPARHTIDLQSRYHDLNRVCFGAGLPNIPVFFDDNIASFKTKYQGDDSFEAYAFARCGPHIPEAQWSIHFRGNIKSFTKDHMDAVLLHEMIHVYMATIGQDAESYNHGPEFKRYCREYQKKSGIKSSVINVDNTYLADLKSQTAKPEEVYVQLIVTHDKTYVARFHPVSSTNILALARHFADFEANPNAERQPSRLPYETWEYVGATSYFLKVKIPVPAHAFQKSFYLSPEDGKKLHKSGHFEYEVHDGEVYTSTLKKVVDGRSKRDFAVTLYKTQDDKYWAIFSEAEMNRETMDSAIRRMESKTAGPVSDVVDIFDKHLGQATAYLIKCSASHLTLRKGLKTYPTFFGPVKNIPKTEAWRFLDFGKILATVVKGVKQ